MPGHRVLYFDTDRFIACRVTSDGIVEVGSYRNDADGLSAFEADLQEGKGDAHYLLAELAEENYHTNLVPFVKGRYRAELLQRRLQRAFPNTDCRLATSIGFEKTNRLNEKLLTIGLTNPDVPNFWLRFLRDHHIRVAGLYSTALLVPTLLSALKQGDTWTIVVTFSPGGMRLTLCEDKVLQFSRLTMPLSFDPVDLATFCASEVTKTIQYLLAVRILPKNLSQITVLVIVPEIDKAIFEHALLPTLSLYPVFVTVETCCHEIGLKHYPGTGLSNAIFCHMLVRKTPDVQFAPTRALQHFRLFWLKKRLFLAMAAIVAIGLAVTIGQVFEGFGRYQQLRVIKTENVQQMQRLQQATRVALGKSVTDAALLTTMSVGYDRILQRQDIDVWAWFSRLDRINRIEPMLHFDRIGWTVSVVRAESKEGATNGGKESLAVTLSFEGFIEFPVDSGDDVSRRFTRSLERFRRFVSDLEREFRADVTILQMPINLTSDKALVLDDQAFEQPRHYFAVDCRFPVSREAR